MRHNQSTLKASTVQAHAQRLLLAELELRDYRPGLPAQKELVARFGKDVCRVR